MVQVGANNPRCYMLGGGDYKTLPDTMYQCRELVKKFNSATYNLQFNEKKKMKYPRHGHSCCAIMNRYIIVSGSRKEVNQAANRVELYDTNTDDWMELSKINEGRHYHSTANLNNAWVYIFGGIQNSSKKYSATIERLQFVAGKFDSAWEKLNLSGMEASISQRQGAGMCQISSNEIMIVGGFNGKFLSDYYILNCDDYTGEVRALNKYENNNMQ